MMFVRARDNPFRTERVLAIRYRPLGWSWESLFVRLASLDYRAAIVGRQGTGKTTLLEDLMPRLQNIGLSPRFARLDADSPRLSEAVMRELVENLTRRDIILLDGCEQLSPGAWRGFLRQTAKAGGLIITTHSPGRLPELVKCRTDPLLLEQIVRELLGPDNVHDIDFRVLFGQHHGNIRNCLRELYDLAP